MTPNRLAEEEMRVKTMSYDPMDPPEEVYATIEDLLDYGEAARAPISQIQAINIAYNIFNRTGKFSDGIIAWIRRPDHEKTWTNLKNHFTEHHDLLRETGELTLQEMQFQSQANIIHKMVCSAIDESFINTLLRQLMNLQEKAILKLNLNRNIKLIIHNNNYRQTISYPFSSNKCKLCRL